MLVCTGSAKSSDSAGIQSRIGEGSDNDLSISSMLAVSSDIFQKGVFGQAKVRLSSEASNSVCV